MSSRLATSIFSTLREALLPSFKLGLRQQCYSVCTAKLVGTRTSFHHTDRGKHVCSFHQSLERTTKRPGLEQPEELGREAIVADLELTEDHEEATEVHPDAGELDLIVGVRAPGEVRKTHHVSAHSPFPEGQPHHVACPYMFKKMLLI